MHLIEKYSLETGLRISKPEIYERFYPVPVSGKYITQYVEHGIHSMQYDYWEDVIEMINPYLKANDIKILNLNPNKVKALDNLTQLDEKIDCGQLAYVVRNSLLHFGETSFATDLACVADTKIVSMYSMAHKECLEPYWGKKKNQIILSPDSRPSYSAVESPKAINQIKPEQVAKSILSLPDIESKTDYETGYTGDLPKNKHVESIPKSVANVNFYPMSIRMDYHFNEKNMAEQCFVGDGQVNIITNRSIQEPVLAQVREKLECVYYLIEENDDPKFVQVLKRLKIPFKLMSYLDKDKIRDKKIKYMDFSPIYQQKVPDPYEIDELKNEDLNKLYYFSNKRILIDGKVYLSKCAFDCEDVHSSPDVPHKVIQNEEFFKELECFRIVRKVS